MQLPDSPAHRDDAEAAQALHQAMQRLRQEIGRRIIGQADVIERLLVVLLAGGHALFVGVPGLAKTSLVQAVAAASGIGFKRIQFTPDLLPSDITGTEVIEPLPDGSRAHRFRPGPLFTNLLLADEINRTPPKTQAALLECMQDAAVTSAGVRHPLGPPFHVFATQNPLEQEGTYPLPEAQLDRFMMSLHVDYPSYEEELEVVRRAPDGQRTQLTPQLHLEDWLAYQSLVTRVPLAEAQLQRIVQLVRRTRPHDALAPAAVGRCISFGAGPRAAQALAMAARARALVQGRLAVDDADIDALARPVLRHRLILSPEGEAEGASADALIGDVLAAP